MKLSVKVINLFAFYFQSRLGGLKFSIGFTPKDKSKENAKGSSKVGNLVKLFELRGSRSSQTESKNPTPVKRESSSVKLTKSEKTTGLRNSDSNMCTPIKSKDTKLFTPVKQATPVKMKGSKFFTPIKSKLKIPTDPIKLAVTPVKALGNFMQKIPTPRRSHRVQPLGVNEKD